MCAVGGESAGRVCGIVEPQMILVDSGESGLVNSDDHGGLGADHRGFDWKTKIYCVGQNLAELGRVGEELGRGGERWGVLG